MLQVIIPAGAAIARRQSYRFKAAASVTGPPVLAFIDIALDQQHRMAPARLPVSVDPLQTQGQGPRGDVGILLAIRQNQKPAVINDKAQTPGALTWRPADFALAGLSVRGSPAEGDQRDQFPIDFSHIAQGLSSQPGTMQIMLFLQQFIETSRHCRAAQFSVHQLSAFVNDISSVRRYHIPRTERSQSLIECLAFCGWQMTTGEKGFS